MKKIFFLIGLFFPLLALAQPCATISSTTVANVLCNGDTTGSVQVIASATATPITYTLGSVNNSSGLFNGLPAGSYYCCCF